MGIASAVETAPGRSGFFCLHRTIYTLGALWIKSAEAGSGQLCICTCTPCLESFKAEAAGIEQLFSGLVVVVRYQEGCRFSISSGQQPDRGEILPTPDRY